MNHIIFHDLFTLFNLFFRASGHDVTFIHPKGNDEYPISGAGVLIELVQAPDSLLKPPVA